MTKKAQLTVIGLGLTGFGLLLGLLTLLFGPNILGRARENKPLLSVAGVTVDATYSSAELPTQIKLQDKWVEHLDPHMLKATGYMEFDIENSGESDIADMKLRCASSGIVAVKLKDKLAYHDYNTAPFGIGGLPSGDSMHVQVWGSEALKEPKLHWDVAAGEPGKVIQKKYDITYTDLGPYTYWDAMEKQIRVAGWGLMFGLLVLWAFWNLDRRRMFEEREARAQDLATILQRLDIKDTPTTIKD